MQAIFKYVWEGGGIMKISRWFRIAALVMVAILTCTCIFALVGCGDDRDTSHYNYYRCTHCNGTGKTHAGASCGWCNGTGMYAVKKDGY